eukprot:jgi/Ulvmu1/2269/UM013_0116.1
MDLPGGPREDADHVTLRCSGNTVCLHVDGRSVQPVPAVALQRSGLLRSFAEGGQGDRRLDLSITEVQRWMNQLGGGVPIDEDSALDILNGISLCTCRQPQPRQR